MDPEDRKLYDEIAEDVLRALNANNFFALLDELYSPASGRAGSTCKHDYSKSLQMLTQLEFDEQERQEILGVLQVRGGCCDCEILFNVAPASRLREKYWKAQERHGG